MVETVPVKCSVCGQFAVMATDTHVVEVQGQLMLSCDQRAVVTSLECTVNLIILHNLQYNTLYEYMN